MNPKNDRTQLERPATAEQLAPRKRFLIVKLEERIAPKRGNTSRGGGFQWKRYYTEAC